MFVFEMDMLGITIGLCKTIQAKDKFGKTIGLCNTIQKAIIT